MHCKAHNRAVVPLQAVLLVLAGILPVSGRAQINVYPVFPLPPVVMRGHMENGINGINNPKDGKTPLMLAVESGEIEVIFYLLERGADLSMRDSNGETAFDMAKRLGSRRIEDILELYLSLHPAAVEYYAARKPRISIIGGQGQTGTPGSTLTRPFTVQITDDGGKPMANAPVKFMVTGDGGGLATSATSPQSDSLTLRTNQNGISSAYFVPPEIAGAQCSVKAMVGPPGDIRQVVFMASVVEDTGQRFRNPFMESNCIGSVDSNGNESISWQNNSDEAAYIEILMHHQDNSWEVLFTLPPNATSAFVSAQDWSRY